MNATEIHKALRELFSGKSHAYVQEFRAGTGYSEFSDRYLDAWVISCFPSSGLVKTAIEIKVSRSDFLKDIRKPMKRDSALRISNQFYFAAPSRLLTEKDLPDECGLIEIDPLTAKAAITIEAPYRECATPTWVFVASLARRAAKSEQLFHE